MQLARTWNGFHRTVIWNPVSKIQFSYNINRICKLISTNGVNCSSKYDSEEDSVLLINHNHQHENTKRLNKYDISAETVMSNHCLFIYRRKTINSRTGHCKGYTFLIVRLSRDMSPQSTLYVWNRALWLVATALIFQPCIFMVPSTDTACLGTVLIISRHTLQLTLKFIMTTSIQCLSPHYSSSFHLTWCYIIFPVEQHYKYTKSKHCTLAYRWWSYCAPICSYALIIQKFVYAMLQL